MSEVDPFAPPLGKPGFDINGDQRGRIIGSCVSIIVITVLFVFLRLISRKLSRAGFWWDDYWAIIALISSIVLPIIWLCEIPNGYGRHLYIWHPDELLTHKKRLWLKGLWVFELLFHTSTTLSKFSILAFYYRIFAIPRFRRVLIWVAIICVVYLVAIDLAIIFQCRPIHYAWDKADPNAHGYCFDGNKFFKGSGSVNVFLNFLIFALPIPLLWRLRTTFKQQMVLTAIFTLAGFVVLVSIIWIVVLSNLANSDVTWNFINAGIWSALEPNMAVVCACIPSLRPLATIVTQGVFNHPLVKSTVKSTSSRTSSKKIWGGSKHKSSDGTFSQMDEADDMRPFGHGVSVYGPDARVEGETLELPQHGIQIKTDIEVSTSERLDYNDRLY